MAVISVRVEKSGRVLIPASVRRQLRLKEGKSDLLLNIDETPIGVTTRAQAVRKFQQWASTFVEPGRLLSQELLDERRKEAASE